MTSYDTVKRRTPRYKNQDDIITSLTIKQSMKINPSGTVDAVMAELEQIQDKNVFQPADLPHMGTEDWHKLLGSIMFIKEKYNPSGDFDKIKARLCANPKALDPVLYYYQKNDSKNSSPTVNIESVFTTMHLASVNQLDLNEYDIFGAYLEEYHMKQLKSLMIFWRNIPNTAIVYPKMEEL